jgi:hypothetical protein
MSLPVTRAEILHNSVAAVCPINGISVGDWSNKNTWLAYPTTLATSTQIAAIPAVFTAFDPTTSTNNPVFLDGGTMISRLSTAEYLQMIQFANTRINANDGTLSYWLDQVRTQSINVNDPRTAQMENYLVTNGILASSRVSIIFSPVQST